MKKSRILMLWTITAVLVLGTARVADGQQVTGDQIRTRIEQSGLTPDQIRDRLAAGGYSRTLLDSYLSPGRGPAPSPSADILAAIAALVPQEVKADGVQPVTLDTGSVRREPIPSATTGADTAPRLFGLDVFRNATTQFQPLLAGPVPDSYRLGAGDVLVLVISGDVERVQTLEVTRDGFILIPQVGQLYVASLTMSQLKQALRQRLGAAFSGIRTGTSQFDVTISRLRTNQVYVVGEVVNPGAYQLASVATVLNALYAAGGPTERAGFRAITVKRMGIDVASFDLYDYLTRGDVRGDVSLEMGDVIFVGVQGTRVAVRGAVVRPAIYELAQGQTLRDVIAYAGGFRADASLRRISISRIVPPSARGDGGPERIVVDVPVDQVVDGSAPAFPMNAGDEVEVFEVPDARRAVVDVKGAVYLPGTYGWQPGLRLSRVVQSAGGLRPAIYSKVAHISRLNATDSTRYLVRVALPEDSSMAWSDDPELQDYDEITIFAREDFRSPRTVRIAGFVNGPGDFAYSDGMTVRDLLLRAGGLRDGASLDSAELARLPLDRSAGQMARIVRLSLDSTYLFERDSTTYRFLPGPEARARGTSEIALEPYDIVTIFPQPDFELQRVVFVGGEVRFPGPYALRRKDERISSLILRAGGILPTGYAEGARLNRAQGGVGRVNIDLQRALDESGGREDLLMQPGDSLLVPEFNPVVRVEGAVTSPAAVQFRPGQPLGYYISNAGGWARDADKWRVSVRAPNGSSEATRRLLFFKNQPSVGPGSVIVVQRLPESEPLNITQLLSAAAQILASTVAIIVVASR